MKKEMTEVKERIDAIHTFSGEYKIGDEVLQLNYSDLKSLSKHYVEMLLIIIKKYDDKKDFQKINKILKEFISNYDIFESNEKMALDLLQDKHLDSILNKQKLKIDDHIYIVDSAIKLQKYMFNIFIFRNMQSIFTNMKKSLNSDKSSCICDDSSSMLNNLITLSGFYNISFSALEKEINNLISLLHNHHTSNWNIKLDIDKFKMFASSKIEDAPTKKSKKTSKNKSQIVIPETIVNDTLEKGV